MKGWLLVKDDEGRLEVRDILRVDGEVSLKGCLKLDGFREVDERWGGGKR